MVAGQTYLDFLRVRDLNASNSCSDPEWRPSPGPSSAHGRWGVRRDEPGADTLLSPLRYALRLSRPWSSPFILAQRAFILTCRFWSSRAAFPSAGLAFSGQRPRNGFFPFGVGMRGRFVVYDFFTPGIQAHQHQGKAREEARDRPSPSERTQPGGRVRRWGGRNWVAMEGAERDEALSTFIAVTGAPYERAREVLDTNDWDLQRALNTHLEVQQHTTSNTAGVAAQRTQQQSSVAAGSGAERDRPRRRHHGRDLAAEKEGRGGSDAPPIDAALACRLSERGRGPDPDAEDATSGARRTGAGAANADADRTSSRSSCSSRPWRKGSFRSSQPLSLSLCRPICLFSPARTLPLTPRPVPISPARTLQLADVTQQHSVANAVGEEAQGMDEDLTGPPAARWPAT